MKFSGAEPVAAELVVETDSFEVLRGDGGVKGLSGPEKTLVRSNALKSLDAGRFPEIRFIAETLDKTDDGYRLTPRVRNPQASLVWIGDENRVLALNAEGELILASLSPRGVAFVSYNSQPGGHVRQMVRDMMLFHVGDVQEPSAKIQRAREFLEFFWSALGRGNQPAI